MTERSGGTRSFLSWTAWDGAWLSRQYRARRPFLIPGGKFGCCSIASRKSSSSATVKRSSWMGFKMLDRGGAAAVTLTAAAWVR